MEVAETKEELYIYAMKIAQYLKLSDIYTAHYIYAKATWEEKAKDWGVERYGAMMTYAAGYVAGIRAERRKKRKNPLGNGNTKRIERSKTTSK